MSSPLRAFNTHLQGAIAAILYVLCYEAPASVPVSRVHIATNFIDATFLFVGFVCVVTLMDPFVAGLLTGTAGHPTGRLSRERLDEAARNNLPESASVRAA